MKYSIVYSSVTGNTKLLAEKIREILPKEDCVYFGEPGAEAKYADRIYAGFWTKNGSCDENFASFLKKLDGKEVFLFGTAGFISESYVKEVLSNVESELCRNAKLIGSFMCRGKMPLSVRKIYEKQLLESDRAPGIQAKLANFDKSLSHPDGNDLDKLKNAVEAVL